MNLNKSQIYLGKLKINKICSKSESANLKGKFIVQGMKYKSNTLIEKRSKMSWREEAIILI